MAHVDCESYLQNDFSSDIDHQTPFSALPPLITNHFVLESSPTGIDSYRRSSFTSSASSSGTDFFSAPSAGTTSPATPATVVPPTTVRGGQYMKSAVSEMTFQPPTYVFSSPFDQETVLWTTAASNEEVDLEAFNQYGCLPEHDFAPQLSDPYCPTYYQVFSNRAMNPSLSRGIFSEPVRSMRHPSITDASISWATSALMSPPQIIAPSAAFYPVPKSSPTSKHDPTTPIRSSSNSSFLINSSPPTRFSPKILLSQRDVEQSPYLISSPLVELSTGDIARVKRATSRLARRQYAKKGARVSDRNPRPSNSKSGIDCPEVIPQNEFACKYKDCIDKQTGKQKKFKRQEHKKRHEKTVHEKERHNQYPCWVPECKTKPFSRTDNLKSHLKKTHGKKSAAARNRYVATQDEGSPYFDPDWVGPLTKEGIPLY